VGIDHAHLALMVKDDPRFCLEPGSFSMRATPVASLRASVTHEQVIATIAAMLFGMARAGHIPSTASEKKGLPRRTYYHHANRQSNTFTLHQ